MAGLIEVHDAGDPRLADYRDLREVQLRQSLESAEGLFIAEGEKVVRRAAEAGFEARSFLMAPRWLDGLSDVLDRTDAPCYVVSEALAEQVTGFHVHRGALASMRRRPLPALDDVLAEARTVVVLEDVVDHTNVGAVFRSAAALGVDALLLSPRCADPLYRRSVKVAMGAVFSLPWTRLVEWYDALPALSARGFTTVALTPADDAVAIEEAVRGQERLALVVGTEGHGLSSRWLTSADRRGVIPMASGIDSLNVAAATAVACYVVRAERAEVEERGALATSLETLVTSSVRPHEVSRLTSFAPQPPREAHFVRTSTSVGGPAGWVLLGGVVVLLGQLLHRPPVEPVAEDASLAVVGLVLQAAREQTVAGVADRRTVEPDPLDLGPVRPGAGDEPARVGETALVAVVELPTPAFGQVHDRVADHALVPLAVVVRAVEDEDREVHADLARGQPDAVGGVHRGDHVGGQGAQLVVEAVDQALAAVHDLLAPPRDGADGASRGQHGVVGGGGARHGAIVGTAGRRA